tara:strand:- start:93 stop:248 length:156 start_codon:yes stop_codon:yes gene_type:complete
MLVTLVNVSAYSSMASAVAKFATIGGSLKETSGLPPLNVSGDILSPLLDSN